MDWHKSDTTIAAAFAEGSRPLPWKMPHQVPALSPAVTRRQTCLRQRIASRSSRGQTSRAKSRRKRALHVAAANTVRTLVAMNLGGPLSAAATTSNAWPRGLSLPSSQPDA